MEKDDVMKVLNQVYDPDYVDRSVVEMGLVTEGDITINGEKINIAYNLTASMCPFSAAIGLMIKYALEKTLAVPVTVSLKAEHPQEKKVTELLKDTEQSKVLMQQLKEFGILKRCIRLED